jgi:transcriptional regulator with XRE-family HTH domain
MNFKELHECKLKMSAEEFAKHLGIDVSIVRELDRTGDPSLKIIQRIAEKTGMSLDEITGYQKPHLDALKAQFTWEKAEYTRKNLTAYIEKLLSVAALSEADKKNYIDDLQTILDNSLIKPTVSIVGRSDTGKSTLINTLLGDEFMPSSWTPTTSIAVYIKHVNDKPSFIRDEVWVFAASRGEEQRWDPKRLYDEEYCNTWCISSGRIIDELPKFGTRQGEHAEQVGSAVVFIDAPVLLNCDIIDLPGFGTDSAYDDFLTLNIAKSSDILIYLSQANGFMRIEDITYLKENIRNLPVYEHKGKNQIPPLANLFVVASQAHTVANGNPNELSNILATGCHSFLNSIGNGYWDQRESVSGFIYDEASLLSRFFTYTTDIPTLCERFNEELRKTMEVLPTEFEDKAKSRIKEYVKVKKPSLEAEISNFEEMVDEREKYVLLLQNIDADELSRVQENNTRKADIKERLHNARKGSREEFTDFFSRYINVDAVMRSLRAEKIKNNKSEIERFSLRIQDEVASKSQRILEDEYRKNEIGEKIGAYVENYSNKTKAHFVRLAIAASFEPGYAFASNLAKFGFLGSVGVLVAAVAAFSFGTSSFLLGAGSVAALVSLLGGPVGVGISLAVTTALGLIRLLGGSWEKKVAKTIVESYEKENALQKYLKAIDDYWSQNEDAFIKATDEVDAAWKDYVQRLRDILTSFDPEEIKARIVVLESLKDFFDNIPL